MVETQMFFFNILLQTENLGLSKRLKKLLEYGVETRKGRSRKTMDSSLTYTPEPLACNSTMSNSGEHVIKRRKKESPSCVGAFL